MRYAYGIESRPQPPQKEFRVKRTALLTASAIATVNIWTGAPLLAVWVGSRIGSSTSTSMTAILAVMGTLIGAVTLLALLVAWLNGRYTSLVGAPSGPRRTAPWLRSMRAERAEDLRAAEGVNGVERTMIIAVLAAVLVLEIWFFFIAGSSLPNS